jgi:putative transposase
VSQQPDGPPIAPRLAELDEPTRALAWRRWQLLAPVVNDAVPLARAAAASGIPLRTAQRWLSRYHTNGLVGLARTPRADRGVRRTQPELVGLIEGLALSTPALSVATITRRVAQVALAHGWPTPAYSTVHEIVTAVDPQLMTLAHQGPEAFRDRYELALRRQANRPNEIWQADHTELDILVLDADGSPARPWLTVVLDDCSRAVPGYTVFLGAPSALNLSLAMRQAIWHKTDPNWVVHGIPEVLYADHGSDFTSHHLAQVCVDLHIHLVHSAVARPQGRGKVERILGSITTELLPELPGHLVRGKLASPPALSLPQLDAAIREWITGVYHLREHSETGIPPQRAWLADGWLPRTPDSLEALDLLLIMVATPRTVHRDGIRFQGLRYHSPILAPYVGKPVTIRYDPRDLGEIRVFHHDRFLCRAINPDHAGETITLKDIQAARVAHRRALREQINSRRAAVAEYLPVPTGHTPTDAAATPDAPSVADPAVSAQRPTNWAYPPARSHSPAASRLRLYQADFDPIDLDDGADPSHGEEQR